MPDPVTRPARVKVTIIVATCLLTILVTGCSGLTWTRLDGGSADEARLEKALQTCRVERKLEGLERAREDRSRELGEAKSNQQKMVARETYSEIERQVYREIDTCMYRQGFRRPG